MTRNSLPYKVECKSSYPFYELIAAFNVECAAFQYAADCQQTNPHFAYRVTHGRDVREFASCTTR